MMLELHNVTIGQQIHSLSLTVNDGQYVPQRLLVPEGYDKVPTDFVSLLRKAVESGKQLLIVDEPSKELTMEERQVVNNLFREAQERGATVLAVNMVTAQNQVTL